MVSYFEEGKAMTVECRIPEAPPEADIVFTVYNRTTRYSCVAPVKGTLCSFVFIMCFARLSCGHKCTRLMETGTKNSNVGGDFYVM